MATGSDISGLKPGQIIYGYHDGKISLSRQHKIEILDIVDREDLSRKYQRIWKKALKEDFKSVFDGCIHYYGSDDKSTKQFWDWNCETFIFGKIVGDEESKKDPMMFALTRPAGYGWYGVNWNFMLDVTGKRGAEQLARLASNS